MRGQVIVVKEFNGSALVVRFWDSNSSGVFIHSEEEFNRRMSGEEYLDPVGFPHEDAFEYDNTARNQLLGQRVDWSILNPLKCPVTAP